MNKDELKRNWLEVNLNHIEHNFNYLTSLSQNSFLPVLKANAYAHGSLQVCKTLIEKCKAKRFAVADILEAVQLKKKLKLGKEIELISLSPVINKSYLKKIIAFGIIPSVVSEGAFLNLIHLLEKQSIRKKMIKPIPIWLKINSGMNRLGIKPDLATQIIKNIETRYKDLIEIKTIFTHLSSAEESPEAFTNFQLNQFNQFINSLDKKYPVSIGNSAFLLHPDISQFDDITRSGLALYGISPFYFEKIPNELKNICTQLKPASSLKARIIALHQINKNDYVGYSRAFKAETKINVATVCIGYADGYPRSIPTGTKVLINGSKARIIGRISMDSLSLDLGKIDAKIGDVVTLFGEGLNVNEIASAANTIPYEILSRCNPRGGVTYLSY